METLKATMVTEHEYLAPGKKLSIVVAADSSAIVERYLDGVLLDKTTLAASATKVFGEYLTGLSFRITCLTGSLTYDFVQSTGGLTTTTNDDAPAGAIGEYIESSVAIGSAVALTTNVEANIASITLTPGDWDVDGVVGFVPAATTSITHLSGSSSLVSATGGGLGTEAATTFPAIVPGAAQEWFSTIPTRRVSIAVNTVVYLTAHTLFTVSTLGGYGVLRARRVR